MIDLDDGPDRIDFGGTICIGIVTEAETQSRRARILGGREWVRLGAVELGLDCLRRFLHGLPVAERIDFERVRAGGVQPISFFSLSEICSGALS